MGDHKYIITMNNKILVNDHTARLIGIPLLSLIIAFLLKSGHPDFSKILFKTFLHTLITWEGCRWLILWFRRKYPQYHETPKRLMVQGLAILLYSLLVAISSSRVTVSLSRLIRT